MTKSNKDETKLKSTAYNQTGQSFFQQLSAYNSMSIHLRRVLQAKSVVDTRNKNYVCKRKQLCKQVDCKPRFLKRGVTNNMIDRMAYDTLHHPADTLRMNFDSKYSCDKDDRKYYINCYDYDVPCSQLGINDAIYYEEDNETTSRSRSRFRTDRSAQSLSSNRQLRYRDPFVANCTNYASKIRSADVKSSRIQEDSENSRYRYDEKLVRCDTAPEFPKHEMNRLSALPNSSQNYDDCEYGSDHEERIANQERRASTDQEKYTEFAYKITREIMENELYTDQQLQQVFKKHLEKNRGTLNMNKMLLEIYQLKMSLNVTDDSEVDDELEDLINTQQLLRVSEIRPPTPPKVLNENKLIEKLMSYQENTEGKRRSSTGNKTVVLIDANPELLVTERDVLLSLMEADIGPRQAQQICKSLIHKSKDTAYIKCNDSSKVHEELDKSSTTSDLRSTEDKNVQVQDEGNV